MKTNNQIKKLPIVLVYLNNKLPKYAAANVKYLSKTFPERDIYIVTNISPEPEKFKSMQNVKFYIFKDFTSKASEVSNLSRLPKEFRNGFWILTILRFLALESFMETHGLNRILHIEADVLLLPKFPFNSDFFNSEGLSFPFASADSAAASIFYVGSLVEIKKFNNFVISSLKQNASLTDMKILAMYAAKPVSKVQRLFSGEVNTTETVSHLIFDAATFGMYLTGQDPRNNKGFKKLYFNIDGHSVRPSEYTYSITNDNRLMAALGTNLFEIVNLHIHSKDRRFFNVRTATGSLKRAVTNCSSPGVEQFSISTWGFLVLQYLLKRFNRQR
jgi:hypothetical protein